MNRNVTFDLIPFVRARSADDSVTSTFDSKTSVPLQCAQDGNEVKSFYESVIAEASSSTKSEPCHFDNEKSKTKKLKRKCHNVPVVTTISTNQFLKAAQEGDLNIIDQYLSRRGDVDVTDTFGWTALMCAAFAGHFEVVRQLITYSANKHLKNSTGETALDLTNRRNRESIAKLLNNEPNDEHQSERITDCVTKFYCGVCKADIENTSAVEHNTSTVHLFNLNIKPNITSYAIPETNKGFQLMLKTGWDKEKGLGPEGQGHKYPVKTILKRDRQGLGNAQQKNKKKSQVTHFGAGDTSAVVNSSLQRECRATTLSKRRRSKLQAKKKVKERNFRREFYQE